MMTESLNMLEYPSAVQQVSKLAARSLVLVFVLLLAGCSSEPQRRDRFFVLEPPTTLSGNGQPLAATLVVQDLAARGFLGGRQIVYRTHAEPLELRRYNLYLWEQPPARALTQDLVEALRGARIFSTVATAGEQARANYRLYGELTRFEHRPTDSSPRVLAELTLNLVSIKDRTVQFSGIYEEEELVSGRRPEDMAAAFNRLTGRIIGLFVEDLNASRGLLAAHQES